MSACMNTRDTHASRVACIVHADILCLGRVVFKSCTLCQSVYIVMMPDGIGSRRFHVVDGMPLSISIHAGTMS